MAIAGPSIRWTTTKRSNSGTPKEDTARLVSIPVTPPTQIITKMIRLGVVCQTTMKGITNGCGRNNGFRLRGGVRLRNHRDAHPLPFLNQDGHGGSGRNRIMTDRNHYWDWLKLLAALAMLVDHLKFVAPAFAPLAIPGRIAMPLFACIAANNFGKANSETYLKRLLPFAVGSEIPFYLLTNTFGNVLLLFLFSFAFFRYGNFLFAFAAMACGYSVAGLGALFLFLSGHRNHAFVGGLLLNAFPSNLISGATALLPQLQIAMPPCPFIGGRTLLWFYPAHLLTLWGAKEMFSVWK